MQGVVLYGSMHALHQVSNVAMQCTAQLQHLRNLTSGGHLRYATPSLASLGCPKSPSAAQV